MRGDAPNARYKTVWKFVLPLSATGHEIELPASAKPVHYELQHDKPTLWIEIPLPVEGQRLVRRQFVHYGTGDQTIPGNANYIGSTLHHGGTFVFHLYEIPPVVVEKTSSG